jgi:hypothetical protein
MTDYKFKKPEMGKKATESFQNMEKKFTEKFLEPDATKESGYTLKTGKLGETVTNSFKKIEDAAVNGYQKMEDTAVNGYKKIEEKFTETFLEPVESTEVEVEEENTETEE